MLVTTIIAVIVGWTAWGGSETDDRLLVVDDEGSISLLDPKTREAVFTVPDAFATPDRSALLTPRRTSVSTTLETRDPRTGTVTSTASLPGALHVRTVSPHSGAVALMPESRPAGLYEPTPRVRTTITVAYADERPARAYLLDGNIEPEMFSVDETALFVLDFRPANDPSGYVVRVLDLASGVVTDTESPQIELNDQMRGRARAQVLHPNGTHLYTLYTASGGAADDSSAHDARDGRSAYPPPPEPNEGRSAFIHVINLEEKWSYCLFLPAPIGTVNEAVVGLGVTPDGSSVLVADPSTSTVARVDADNLKLTDVRTVDRLRDRGAKAALTVAPDGTTYVSSGNIVLELSAGTLAPVAAFSHTETVSGLAVSASGTQLRVAGGGRVSLVDRSTRLETDVLRAPSDGGLDLLGPPSGSVTQFPLECAC